MTPMLNVPIEFVLFALTLVGIAVLHHRTFEVAVTGLSIITLYKLLFADFDGHVGAAGLAIHLGHEWVTIANLGGLLLGFGLLSVHFEKSRIPQVLPRFLPTDWKGPLALLVMVFVLSSFLDNIAAALIGGAMVRSLFPSIHIGYIAAIVAASNAGGSGSVVGDTTTTMMWIAGVAPGAVFHAYIAAVVALFVCGVPAALQQHKRARMVRPETERVSIDWARVAIVALVLATAIVVNVTVNLRFEHYAEALPFLGMAVWAVLLATAAWRAPDWPTLRASIKGTAFLLALVTAASMMPVERLPLASWQSALGLGFISAGFDNIPLTALALEQGGYDWGVLAYSVGFGGSMIWFGSSAGVAITTMFPEGRSVWLWLKHGWHVTAAYVVGFFAVMAVLGWHPTPTRAERGPVPSLASPEYVSTLAYPGFLVECRNMSPEPTNPAMSIEALRLDREELRSQGLLGSFLGGFPEPIPPGGSWKVLVELRPETSGFRTSLSGNDGTGALIRVSWPVALARGAHTVAFQCAGQWTREAAFTW